LLAGADELIAISREEIHDCVINLNFSDEAVSAVTKLELKAGFELVVADADFALRSLDVCKHLCDAANKSAIHLVTDRPEYKS
jgi:hypothetical protein